MRQEDFVFEALPELHSKTLSNNHTASCSSVPSSYRDIIHTPRPEIRCWIKVGVCISFIVFCAINVHIYYNKNILKHLKHPRNLTGDGQGETRGGITAVGAGRSTVEMTAEEDLCREHRQGELGRGHRDSREPRNQKGRYASAS